jgi:hypothetical protein
VQKIPRTRILCSCPLVMVKSVGLKLSLTIYAQFESGVKFRCHVRARVHGNSPGGLDTLHELRRLSGCDAEHCSSLSSVLPSACARSASLAKRLFTSCKFRRLGISGTGAWTSDSRTASGLSLVSDAGEIPHRVTTISLLYSGGAASYRRDVVSNTLCQWHADVDRRMHKRSFDESLTA